MTLIPVTEIEEDRFFRHPNGHVLLRVNDDCSLQFRTEAALDAWLEAIDRERSPGRDPWGTAAYHARMQELREELATERGLREVG